MSSIAKAFMEERPLNKKDFWENELKSLGIEPKRQNEFNDKEELESLADIIKEVYFQEYKTAYGDYEGSSSSNSGKNNNNIKRIRIIT
ncbi:MAG: hypothetical protein M3115_06475 [Thermoproteota archaeon]|nr:hypothetical protein [Thermoproteota archaeon]